MKLNMVAYDSEIKMTRHYRDIQDGSHTFVGHTLSQLNVCATLMTKKDVNELIDLLNIHNLCLPDGEQV